MNVLSQRELDLIEKLNQDTKLLNREELTEYYRKNKLSADLKFALMKKEAYDVWFSILINDEPNKSILDSDLREVFIINQLEEIHEFEKESNQLVGTLTDKQMGYPDSYENKESIIFINLKRGYYLAENTYYTPRAVSEVYAKYFLWKEYLLLLSQDKDDFSKIDWNDMEPMERFVFHRDIITPKVDSFYSELSEFVGREKAFRDVLYYLAELFDCDVGEIGEDDYNLTTKSGMYVPAAVYVEYFQAHQREWKGSERKESAMEIASDKISRIDLKIKELLIDGHSKEEIANIFIVPQLKLVQREIEKSAERIDDGPIADWVSITLKSRDIVLNYLKQISPDKTVNDTDEKTNLRMHTQIFKGNAFEVWQSMFESFDIKEGSRTDVKYVYETMKRDGLIHSTVSQTSFLEWISNEYGLVIEKTSNLSETNQRRSIYNTAKQLYNV